MNTKRFGEFSTGAHRVSFVIYNDDLAEGEVVMHSCDNPFCINPNHLSKGSTADNNKDRSLKGRTSKTSISRFSKKGQASLRAKNNFPFEKVLEIRRMREEDKISYNKIAEHFGVVKSYVMDICKNKCRLYE